ncbi:VOC family protein [Sphingorhabdus sp.]|uniref:VOC family protein n=1 Tax=Sphingorhabdus sp. TaxID=1902408 RepID=UPI00391AB4E8
MTDMIFVNFPVANLPRAMAFYTALGFSNNPSFTDNTAACMVWNEAINVMLLTYEKWGSFTTRPLPPVGSSEVMVALSLSSKKAVDAMNDAAAAHGGVADVNPVQDHGFMYGRDFTDPDGHVWGPFWMDITAMGQIE